MDDTTVKKLKAGFPINAEMNYYLSPESDDEKLIFNGYDNEFSKLKDPGKGGLTPFIYDYIIHACIEFIKDTVPDFTGDIYIGTLKIMEEGKFLQGDKFKFLEPRIKNLLRKYPASLKYQVKRLSKNPVMEKGKVYFPMTKIKIPHDILSKKIRFDELYNEASLDVCKNKMKKPLEIRKGEFTVTKNYLTYLNAILKDHKYIWVTFSEINDI